MLVYSLESIASIRLSKVEIITLSLDFISLILDIELAKEVSRSKFLTKKNVY